MYNISDEAILVARRFAQVDQETIEPIWNEAHIEKGIPLIALLLTVEQHF